MDDQKYCVYTVAMYSFDTTDFTFDAIVFDCDGTLVNSAPLHFTAFKVALEQQGALLNRDWYMSKLGLSRQELITEFCDENSINLDIPRAVVESETQFLTRTGELTEIPEVSDIARHYFEKMPLAVASSGQKQSVQASLKSVGMAHLFDCILTADDVSACKPDPAIYIAAAKRLDVEISTCLVFEDTDEGLMSATAAGAQIVDVRTFASIYTGLSSSV